MDESFVPQDWKDAHVIPIFKKGAKAKASNYRPVSLTAVICKVMETCVKDYVLDYLIFNNLLKSSQHGFLPHRSCSTNLLEFLEIVTHIIDNGNPIDILYLDFSKAFDKVSHKKLLQKLRKLGIKGKILSWTEDWLKNRRQKVIVNGAKSSWKSVNSGVPQGSVLGPLLFVIYINDLDTATTGMKTTIKFADDTKVAHSVTSDSDCEELQTCIDKLLKWSDEWGMDFNKAKCKIMHLGRHNPEHVYFMGNHQLESITEERDIGVVIQKDLKPTRQCLDASNRAKAVLGQLCRSFHYRDRHIFVRLYCTYVRPHLEFCTPVWSPASQHDIRLIESVQMKAVNMISGLAGSTYSEKLEEIGLMSLEMRRRRNDMIQVFKILEGYDNVNPDTWFRKASENSLRSTRQSVDPTNLLKPKVKTELRSNFFSVRIVNEWNHLPLEIKMAPSLSLFKSNLDRYLTSTDSEHYKDNFHGDIQ